VRRPTLESWAFLPAGRPRPRTSPPADISLPSAGSLSSSHHLITTLFISSLFH